MPRMVSLTMTFLAAAMCPPLLALEADPPIDCTLCEQWNVPHAPFRVFGNTYYVGSAGLSAILIDGGDSLILLDGALSQTAAQIADNINRLGFALEDVEFIGLSHAHFDHAGGLNALQRASDATVLSSPAAASALIPGLPQADDPQVAYGDGFPAVRHVSPVQDQETISVGNQTLTVHYTPGHTPGGTSWTWRSCEADRCLDMVYADSLSAVSAPGFLFSEHPDTVAALRQSIARVAALPCDIMISTHPEFSGVFAKLALRESGANSDAMLDPAGCENYATTAHAALEQRLADEQQ